MTSTTIISSSVKPCSRFMRARFPNSVADVPVLALAAFLAVGAERDEVEGLALARGRVAVVVPPRVLELLRILHVGPVPLVLGAARRLHEVLERARVLADLELVHLDLAGEVL